MNGETIRVKEIYAGKVAGRYDMSMTHFFARFKKTAFADSTMKRGDRVLVFCCGTGLDFPHILKRIGPEGQIVGIDFSPAMIRKAQIKIMRNRWKNVRLIEADVLEYRNDPGHLFDVGVCTLGMSIIPDYKRAYKNLLASIKKGGEVIIGDMQLASGRFARFNPFTLFLAKRYGGSLEGHRKSLALRSRMEQDLQFVRSREFFLRSYFYCIGTIK